MMTRNQGPTSFANAPFQAGDMPKLVRRGRPCGFYLKVFVAALALAACGKGLAAETGAVAWLKSACTNHPQVMAIKFTCTVHRAAFSSTVTLTNQNGGRVVLDPTVTTYQECFRDGAAFVAVWSKQALDDRFHPNAGFCATGLSTNGYWQINPTGQIIHHQGGIAAKVEELFEQRGSPLSFYLELQHLLSFGIEAKSMVWSGNSFSGQEAVDGRDYAPRGLAGELSMSNGLPASVSYRLGPELYLRVRYTYARSFEVPFPSTVSIERFVLEPNGSSNLLTATTCEVTDFRVSLTADDRKRFDPEYFFEQPPDFSSVSTEQVVGLPLFLALKHPVAGDNLSRYLKSQLSPEAQGMLSAFKGQSNEALEQAVTRDLERVVRAGPLYEAERFDNVTLSSNSLELLREQPRGSNLVRLNQMLLLDAYRNRIGGPPREFLEKDGVPVAVRRLDGSWHPLKQPAKGTPEHHWVLAPLLAALLGLPLAVLVWRGMRARKNGDRG